MKWLAALSVLACAAFAPAERILLIPLDSRPATGQFAQMIGNVAGDDVQMPPFETLGRFLEDGKPDLILDWLAKQDLSDVSTVIVSTDMIAYGGLIASREDHVDVDTAMARIHRLVQILGADPHVKIYAYTSTMRLAPTATTETGPYAHWLSEWAEFSQKYAVAKDLHSLHVTQIARRHLTTNLIEGYLATRERDHEVQEGIVRMLGQGDFDYLIVGQDDAKPYGPQIPETDELKQLADALHAQNRIFFCEGVDQNSNVLLSRALLTSLGWTPKVKVVYSDDAGKSLYANFETKPIDESVLDQIEASGAELATGDEDYDYILYVNTPDRAEDKFQDFLSRLQSDIDQGLPTAVADIDLVNGVADRELFAGLEDQDRMMHLLSYAGWNTAGNTLGTAIPAANVYLLARRMRVDPLRREIAQREFLLHRFVNDFDYHFFTRPAAYQMIREMQTTGVSEIYGRVYAAVNAFVRRDLGDRLRKVFNNQFLGHRFFAGSEEYAFSGIHDVKIWLPWPRAYEVSLRFKLEAEPYAAGQSAVLALAGPRQ